MRTLIIAYHGDYMNGRMMAQQTLFHRWATSIEADLVYPDGPRQLKNFGWRGWPDKWGGRELDHFDTMSRGYDDVHLLGYSDGASMANFIGCHRSSRVGSITSYAGRMRAEPYTDHKYPVMVVWNEKDRRYYSAQDEKLRKDYKVAGHFVWPVLIPNGLGHMGGWDTAINDRVIQMIESTR